MTQAKMRKTTILKVLLGNFHVVAEEKYRAVYFNKFCCEMGK
jgi:hypothetical protein